MTAESPVRLPGEMEKRKAVSQDSAERLEAGAGSQSHAIKDSHHGLQQRQSSRTGFLRSPES